MRVGFGNLFKVKGEKNRVDLIIDVSERSFEVVQVRKREGKLGVVSIAGTGGPEYISKILNKRLSLDEVISAFNI